MPIKSQIRWNNLNGHYYVGGIGPQAIYPKDQAESFDEYMKVSYWCYGFPYNFFGRAINNNLMGTGGPPPVYDTRFTDPRLGHKNNTHCIPGGYNTESPACQPGAAVPLAYSCYTVGRTTFWPDSWGWGTDEVEDPRKMEGSATPFVEGGGEDDERINDKQRGCKSHLNCPEWAQTGELWSYKDMSVHGASPIVSYFGRENPETFYGINDIYLTSGAVDKVGDWVHIGQANGRRILSHTGASQIDSRYTYKEGIIYSIDGVDRSGINYIVDQAPGKSNAYGKGTILKPDKDEWISNNPHNLIDMNDYNSWGTNSFFLNLLWYPRYDPYGTYSGVYQRINDMDVPFFKTGNSNPNEFFFNQNLVSKYTFSTPKNDSTSLKQYTWIPYLARATGFIGGYLWHTIKHLGDTGLHPSDGEAAFDIRNSYRDIGIGKDGIGSFFNFTGEEAKICKEPGEPLETTVQYASGLVYTGHNFSGTGGVNYNWSRQNFTSGYFANVLDDVTNNNSVPEGSLAPSVLIVDALARFFERKEPSGLYSGKNYFPICQDPFIARPSAVKITHNPSHRGSAHAALFIEPQNKNNTSWDFDFTGFQMGDGMIGTHSGRDTNNLSPTGNLEFGNDRSYWQARLRGSGVAPQNPADPHNRWDGWYPISHFYHHNTESEAEYKEIYKYAPVRSWYDYNTGSFDTIHGFNNYNFYSEHWPSDYFIPAPFSNSNIYSSYHDISSYDLEPHINQVCYHTYIPVESSLAYVKTINSVQEEALNLNSDGMPLKVCGHRFLSGIRSIGVFGGNEEEQTELLHYTRNRRTWASGGFNNVEWNDLALESASVGAVETGEIVSPRFELANLDGGGDMYTFHISGWANWVFPQEKTRHAQYITGFPYVCSHMDNIKPRIKKWFCPTEKDSLSSAKSSHTQSVRIGEWIEPYHYGGQGTFMNQNSCINQPDTYHYNVNIISDSWAIIDSNAPTVAPHLTYYNELLEDISSTPGVIGNLGNLGQGFIEGMHDFYCGDVLASVVYNGKMIDGHTDDGRLGGHYSSVVTETPSAVYWSSVGGKEGAVGFGGGLSETVHWTTGMWGFYNTSGNCRGEDNTEPGLSKLNNFSEFVPVSEYSRRDLTNEPSKLYIYPEHVFPNGITGKVTVPSDYSGKDFSNYPRGSIQESKEMNRIDHRPMPSTDIKNIILPLSHPNRGMAHFDIGEMFITGNNNSGVDFRTGLGPNSVFEYPVPWDRIGGSSATISNIKGFKNYNFVRKWEIKPADDCHEPQTFHASYFQVWQEPTNPVWMEPMVSDMGEGEYFEGGYGESPGDGNDFGEDGLPTVPITYDSSNVRIQVHGINQFWCPIVFHATTGDLNSFVKNTDINDYGYDISANPVPTAGDAFSTYCYECPHFQMPFAKRKDRTKSYWHDRGIGPEYLKDQEKDSGSRYFQEWPVILDWFNYGNFEKLTDSNDFRCHAFDGNDGTFKGSKRSFQDDLQEASTTEDIIYYGFLSPHHANNSSAFYDWSFSSAKKEEWSYTPYDNEAANFVLRLCTGITYQVTETSMVFEHIPYVLDEYNAWNSSPYERLYSEYPFHTRTGYFQSNGSYLLSESKRQKLIDDGVDPANVEMEMIYNTVNNIDDHVSGYISYQSTLDEHYCTFNVRNGTGLSPYKQTKQFIKPATGSFNCDGGAVEGDGELQLDELIMLPCWNTVITENSNCQATTYKGMPIEICEQQLKRNKTVLNAGMYTDTMIDLIKTQNVSVVENLGTKEEFDWRPESIQTESLAFVKSGIIDFNKTASGSNDYDYILSSYGMGLAEHYTTLELGASQMGSGHWFSYATANGHHGKVTPIGFAG